MLAPFTNQVVEDEPQYRVCKTEGCAVVYFADESDLMWEVDDVRVPVEEPTRELLSQRR